MEHETKTAEMVALRHSIERALETSPDGWARIETPCTTVEVDAVLREWESHLRCCFDLPAASCDWVSYSDDGVDHRTDCWYALDEGSADMPPELEGWRILIKHAA